jgi:hypothetical protein
MTEEKVPWPTLHTGLTPDDLPYGYSAYPAEFDDGRGYDPVVVGSEVNEDGRLVIKIALSPGTYGYATVVLAGQAPEVASRAVVAALGAFLRPGVPARGQPSGDPQGPPVQGHLPREAH